MQGGVGNGAYASANAFLDALVRYRRSQGLPGHTYNMNSLSDVGLLKRNAAARNWQRKFHVEMMTSLRGLETMELGLVVGYDQLFSQYFTEPTMGHFPSKAQMCHQLQEVMTVGMDKDSTAMRSAKEIAVFLAEEVKDITQVSSHTNCACPLVLV